jgi:glycosyltransferase involved in cell wall biosynthesis
MTKQRIIVTVTNDLVTDQRVHKVCMFLHERGHDVLLVGRKRKMSPDIDVRPYLTRRMKLLFEKGALFYAAFNLRLFFFLLFSKFDLVVANDLDTLLACYRASKFRGKKLVYDSHEYFTEVPELIHRPRVQKFWEGIEKRIFPKLQVISTVNESIAGLYEKKYGKNLFVVRNIPPLRQLKKTKTRSDLGLPEDKKILIIQGAGINIHRGNEEMVSAMKYLDGFLLLICGDGDVVPQLKDMVVRDQLNDRVNFYSRMPYSELMEFTQNADMGITLDKANNINYKFSLPNKLFDFIHAGIPVLSSDLPEVGKIVREHCVGVITATHDPEKIAALIRQTFSDDIQMETFRENCKRATQSLTWENECKVLDKMYSEFDA